MALTGKPTLLCSFSRQFGGWVRDVAAPLTLAYTGQKLVQIETGSAFDCRARYDKPGAVPSEHAKSDAIDVASFVLSDNRRVRVKSDSSDVPHARDLMHALRMTACGYFTTVLGPGSDAAHAEHLHFDSGVHGATPNYRICEMTVSGPQGRRNYSPPANGYGTLWLSTTFRRGANLNRENLCATLRRGDPHQR